MWYNNILKFIVLREIDVTEINEEEKEQEEKAIALLKHISELSNFSYEMEELPMIHIINLDRNIHVLLINKEERKMRISRSNPFY